MGLLTTVSYAAAQDKPVTGSVNQIMTQIGHVMETLFPVLFDDSTPSNTAASNEKKQQIGQSISQLQQLFKAAKPHFDNKSLTYRISFEVIEKQLDDASIALKYKNDSFARNILKDFVSVCTSCHTQDSKLRTLFSGINRSHFKSDLEFGEFNYMTRNYPAAIDAYNRYLANARQVTEADLMTIMKRTLTIYVQVYNQPENAVTELEKLKNAPGHTAFSAKTLVEWLAGTQDLVKENVAKVTIKNFNQLNSRVTKILGPLNDPGSAEFPSKKEKVARVWLRGLLYRYLNTFPPKDEIPEILYWLAIIDRSINYSFYFSLADMYLKECMLQYTSHPYAKKCYEEYESYITFSYSGSRGTDIPDDIQQELKALKVKVYTAPQL